MDEVDIPLRFEDGLFDLELLAMLIVSVNDEGGIEGWRIEDDLGRPVPMDLTGAKVRQLYERHISQIEEAYV